MGLINSRAGVTRVTLEERKRREPEIALEDGVSTPALLFYCVFSNTVCTMQSMPGGSPAA
jgi:hypothetical protein